jgi:hypothetical protein
MKNCTLALPHESAEEAFSHSARFGCRAFALFRVIALLALAFPVALAAQPSIVAQPQSATTVPGATVTFSVTATGSALDYQWLENYLPLPGRTNSSLVLIDVSTNSAARYAVVVSNASGAVTSSTAILSILTGPPSFQTEPHSQSVWGGTSVTFSVGAVGGGASGNLPAIGSGALQLWLMADAGVAAGSGGLVSQWGDQSGHNNDASQTNTNLQPALAYPADLGGSPVVRFNGIQNNINGSYLFGPGAVNVPNAMTSFTVYDAFSSANNENLIWEIGFPDAFGDNRIDMIVGGDIYFSFWSFGYEAPFTVPTNTYRIRIDQLDANLDSLNIFDTTADATTNFMTSFSGAGAPGAGYYLGGLNSSVTGSAGSSRNFDGDIAEIIVYQGALSEADRLAVSSYLQQKYYQINGPGLSFQWLFNGTNLSGATNAFLALPSVQAGQAGTYTVVASNAFGSVTSSNAVLEVNLIPIILAQPTNQMVVAGQTAAFSVLAEGPVPLQYQWTFDGTNIAGATNSALAFSNALPSEAGTYAVILGTEPNVTVSSNAVLSLVAQNEIISSLDPGELTTALEAGGTVTFAVDGTIVLTNTITLSNSVALDGTNHSITISGGGAVQIFNLLPAGQLTLRNLTLADGVDIETNYNYYPPIQATSYGGAIFTQGTLDVENCTFTNNRAPGGNGPIEESGFSGAGGAIYNSGSLSITNTLFVYNLALGGSGYNGDFENGGDAVGGAIYNTGGNINIGNVVFSNNFTSGGAAAGGYYWDYCGDACGGAIYSVGGSLQADNIQVFNCGVSGGQSGQETFDSAGSTGGVGYGGGLYLSGCTAVISNGVFSNNVASGGFGNGAAGGQSLGGSIMVNTGSTILWNCVFQSCQARGAPGGAYSDYPGASLPGLGGAIYNIGTMQITGSIFSNNSAIGGDPSADGLGGAIYNTASLKIEGTSLEANNAVGAASDLESAPGNGWGGAIYNTGSLEIDNSTLSNNGIESGTDYGFLTPTSENGWGGGIANTGFVQLSSTTLSNNTSSVLNSNVDEIYNTGIIEPDAESTIIPLITGTPRLSYQWQINGANIAGATNSIFNLGSGQFGSPGNYDLVISNATGLVTNFLEIVNQPPPMTVSRVFPNSGLTIGGTSVTIVGTGFTNVASVTFGNVAATSVTVVNATEVMVKTSAATTAGVVNVTVVNGDLETVVLTNGFTYVAPVSVSPPPPGPGTNGIFVVDIGGTGLYGYNYTVEASTDLVNWLVLQTNSSPFTFTDTNAGSYPRRFYRGVRTQ